MTRSALFFVSVILPGAALVAGCSRVPGPPPECDHAWRAAGPFVDLLLRATASATPVWAAYGLDDGTYVIDAGPAATEGTCLAVVRAGRVAAFAALPQAPARLTPLYGYHLSQTGNGGPFDSLVEKARQPEPVREWLSDLGVVRAVIIPSEIRGLPFEIPLVTHVQLAVHEAFHVEVQAEGWLGTGGDWPRWDLQPDRAAVRSCYAADSTVVTAFGDERSSLESLIVALLDDDKSIACRSADQFLARRRARYALLDSVRIAGHDGTPLSCETAEQLLEIEEGTADYASWARLFQDGVATRSDLLQRYRAQQNEPFYLTGAMQLHAAYLMNPGAFEGLVGGIIGSDSPADGSITHVLEAAEKPFCVEVAP